MSLNMRRRVSRARRALEAGRKRMASSEKSIYPIRQLYFQCDGCKAQWMLRPDPPIDSAAALKAFTSDPKKMNSCPKSCGATTCSMLFKVDTGEPVSGEKTDPFLVFDAPKTKGDRNE